MTMIRTLSKISTKETTLFVLPKILLEHNIITS
jgi:hypothetical protein